MWVLDFGAARRYTYLSGGRASPGNGTIRLFMRPHGALGRVPNPQPGPLTPSGSAGYGRTPRVGARHQLQSHHSVHGGVLGFEYVAHATRAGGAVSQDQRAKIWGGAAEPGEGARHHAEPSTR